MMKFLRRESKAPEVRLVPTQQELDTAKLVSKWDLTLFDDGQKVAYFDDVREVETDGLKVCFDDKDGFGHEFYGFGYRLDERV